MTDPAASMDQPEGSETAMVVLRDAINSVLQIYNAAFCDHKQLDEVVAGE